LPYKEVFSKDNGWITLRGDFFQNVNKAILTTKGQISSNQTFLDGTLNWTNYIFNSNLDWNKGSHLLLTGRFQDDKNYVACLFNDEKLRIEQYLKGKRIIIVEKQTFFKMPKNNAQFGISVNGNKVECLVDGNSVISAYNLDPALSHGGIGFKTWDQEINNSEIIIKMVNVEQI
ncbi:MAG: hypothetical protein AAB614_01930, partial [Patescibacteria group bacterium]